MSNGLTTSERLTPSQLDRAAAEMFEFVWIDAESVSGDYARQWDDDDISEAARRHWRDAARRVIAAALDPR